MSSLTHICGTRGKWVKASTKWIFVPCGQIGNKSGYCFSSPHHGPFVSGSHRWPAGPHKGPVLWRFDAFLLLAWTNWRTNNQVVGDLSRYYPHVTSMECMVRPWFVKSNFVNTGPPPPVCAEAQGHGLFHERCKLVSTLYIYLIDRLFIIG